MEAGIYQGMRQLDKAIPKLQAVYQAYEKGYGKDHPETIEALKHLNRVVIMEKKNKI